MVAMNLDGYVDVPTRHRMALADHPDLRVIEGPVEVVTVGDSTFIAVTMTVYRSPEDPLPTSATAWEPFPGRTPYQRNSEMMNASTSALGRALGLMGYGIGRSIASADEVASRQEETASAPQAKTQAKRATLVQLGQISALCDDLGITSKEAKLGKVVEVIGRSIPTSKDLDALEAKDVIEALTTERNFRDRAGVRSTDETE